MRGLGRRTRWQVTSLENPSQFNRGSGCEPPRQASEADFGVGAHRVKRPVCCSHGFQVIVGRA